MYEKGDLKITGKPCDEFIEVGFCDCYPIEHEISDERGDESQLHPVVYLPHSCDEWVIGKKENIILLINDLQEILNDIE